MSREFGWNRATIDRRGFLLAAAAGSTAMGRLLDEPQVLAASKAGLRSARSKAVRRQRRIIFNNDGDDIWTKGADTVDRFLDVRHRPLLGTQVDTIFYCTTQSFNKFTHATDVAEQFLSRNGSFPNNNLGTFIKQGTDGIRMSADFCRRHSLESFWTLRMNDIHDSSTADFLSQWKQDDPTRIMSSLDAVQQFNDRRRLWSLVDFEHPDVEPRLLAIIQEVLQKYPIDGIELDWLRAPFYFRSHYEGKPVTDKQVGVLTRIHTSIRDLVLEESEKQGRPILLASRVPVTRTLCRRIGIDIDTWLQNDLLDILAISGGYVTVASPVEELITLGHKYGVPVYPCLSQSGLMYRPPRGNGETQEPASWFAAAQNSYTHGADGMYAFNLFPGPYVYPNFQGPDGAQSQIDYVRKILSHMGTEKDLRETDKLYAISDAGNYMPIHYWSKDAEDFSVALPQALNKGKENQLPDLVIPESPRSIAEYNSASLRIDLTGQKDGNLPVVKFNGREVEPASSQIAAGVRRMAFTSSIDDVKAGVNSVVIIPSEDGTSAAGADLWLQH